MAVWNLANIKEQPSVRLMNWSIKKTNDGRSFFVGDEIGAAGRVSTNIIEYDSIRKLGKSMSGRVYELVGEPRWSTNGEYVWGVYKEINGLVESEQDYEYVDD